MRLSMKALSALAALSTVILAGPAQATHHGRIHHPRHYSAMNHRQYSTWQPPVYSSEQPAPYSSELYSQQYSPCGAACRPGQIDPSRPGGLDANFTPRGK